MTRLRIVGMLKKSIRISWNTYAQYCHSDGGGISVARSTKIDAFDCEVCFASLLSHAKAQSSESISLRLCVKKLKLNLMNNGKKANCLPLAPIAVKILLCWCSAQKIATESGTIIPKKAKYFCSKIN
jgi:hypothetical protein